MEVSGQIYAMATLSSKKDHPVPIEEEGGWTQQLVMEALRKKTLLDSARNQNTIHPFSKPLLSHCID
jgi:hypothetical protein